MTERMRTPCQCSPHLTSYVSSEGSQVFPTVQSVPSLQAWFDSNRRCILICYFSKWNESQGWPAFPNRQYRTTTTYIINKFRSVARSISSNRLPVQLLLFPIWFVATTHIPPVSAVATQPTVLLTRSTPLLATSTTLPPPSNTPHHPS